ncbi:MAG: hypothetical protein OEL76_07820 [Siculibacillus sp.]|nr:hypothetical protein [Siculibacillus sp.]
MILGFAEAEMARGETVLSEGRGRVDIARPVEERQRGIAAAVGGVVVFLGIVGMLTWRPSIVGFPDAALFFVLAASLTIGAVLLTFALYGGEWIVSFEAASGTVRQELRTFGNLTVIDGFVFEDLSGLCAVRDADADGYRLFMVEAENGRPLHIGDFSDEAAMRRAARAINTVHPGLKVG